MEKFKFLATVNILLIKDEKILLTRRANTGYFDGSYECPSGHIDGKETVRQSAIREAMEEIGVAISLEDLSVVHVTHRYGEKNERFEFYLLVKKWTGEPMLKEPEECDDLQWFSLDSLPENMVPKTKSGIEEYLKGNIYSEYDWK
jgi:8-oxo-dGTP diphosphatase